MKLKTGNDEVAAYGKGCGSGSYCIIDNGVVERRGVMLNVGPIRHTNIIHLLCEQSLKMCLGLKFNET